jgi:hypothetical protein
MDIKEHPPQRQTRILESRIRWLDLEEWMALHRCDWAAARNIVLQRAPLKETCQRAAAPVRSRT